MSNISLEEYEKMLGIKHGCSPDELETAYYDLLAHYDPSKLPDDTSSDERMKVLDKYYEIIELHDKYQQQIIEPAREDLDDSDWIAPTYEDIMSNVENREHDDDNKKDDAKDQEADNTLSTVIASKIADLVGTKKPDGGYDKKETAKKVGGIAATVAAGAFIANKMSAGGNAATVKRTGCLKRIVGGFISIAVVLLLLFCFVIPMFYSGNSNSNGESFETSREFSYLDIAFDDTAWYRDGSSVYASVKITNTNTTHSLIGAKIRADFYDINGDKCYSGSFDCGYLLPGQTGYAGDVFSISQLDEIDRVDCYINEGDSTWLVSDYDGYNIPLDASNTTVMEKTEQENLLDTTNSTIDIDIVNNNDTLYDNGYVFIAAYYLDGKMIAVIGDTFATDIPANSTVNDTMNVFVPSEYDNVEFYAYPTFDSQDLR